MTSRRVARVSVLSFAVLAPASCNHFSCAGWDTLPQLKAGPRDDDRTKAVVLKWRNFYIDRCGGWSGRS